MTIRMLPENLINQIAAGEVVERPSSIIKELFENSIDAGASRISLSIRNSGLESISVDDNGCGISKEELPLAAKRFATSKLTNNNLNEINHFGFRGEAIPAIASVSMLSILTKQKNAKYAYLLEVDNGIENNIKIASRSEGTTITVKSLFIKTPARLKFLKSNRIELSHCKNIFTRFALAHPLIVFELQIDGKNSFSFNIEKDFQLSFINRVKLILGEEFYSNCIKINEKSDNSHLKGYISSPTFNKNTTENLYFFVNNRLIKDRNLIGAVRAAYGDTIPRGRFPSVILFIDIPYYMVDVNVHPAKTEVRFQNLNLIKSLIIKSIRKLISNPLNQINNVVNLKINNSSFENSDNKNIRTNLSQENLNIELLPASKTYDQNDKKSYNYPLGAAKAQLNSTFIISETSDGIILVDQHAAHERIVMEELKKNFHIGKIPSQILLIPEVINLNTLETNQLIENIKLLDEIGFKIEPFGENTIIVREVPEILDSSNISKIIKDIAENFSSKENIQNVNDKINEIFAKISCYGSVRAGRKLNVDEMNSLLRKMESTPNSGQCNHGRPTKITLSFDYLEKLFERK